MPIFTLNELEAAREWFPGVDQLRMMELYGRWGGSIRWVLKQGDLAKSIRNAAKLLDATSSMSIEVLERALTGDRDAQVLSSSCNIEQCQQKG